MHIKSLHLIIHLYQDLKILVFYLILNINFLIMIIIIMRFQYYLNLSLQRY